eukprot:snap_masked-scaffold_4-processed-gene-2.18-mRNA-1 protein AED:1.00 eAED:1.00 QI:0/0/0/0/1/1/2/0/559
MLSSCFFKLLLFSNLHLLNAEVSVTFVDIQQTLGPFNTPRFSENIAEFSGSCQIEAPGSVLLPNENPCVRKSIQRDLSGQVILVGFLQEFGCFEETAFENLEDLGVIAVINTGARPGGISMYTSHIGHKKDDIQIPILDTSFEFLINVFGRLQQTGENFTVEINNCADENPYEKCYNTYEPLLSLLVIPLALNNFFLSQKGLNSLKITEGTKPRRFILTCTRFFSVFLLFLMFFNFLSTDGFVWITGGNYKTNLALGLIGVNNIMSHLKNSKFMLVSRVLFNENFFKGFGFYFCFIICFALLIGQEAFLLQAGINLANLVFLFIVLDAIIGVIFGITNYFFVTNVIKTLELRRTKRVEGRKTSRFSVSLCTKITGIGLLSIIRTKSFTEDSTSKKTYILATHLSSWIVYYFGFFFLIVIVDNFVVKEMITFERFEDATQLEFCTLTFITPILVGLRTLMAMCLIKGVIGPNETKSGTLTATTNTRLKSSRFPSALSSVNKPSHYFTNPKFSVSDVQTDVQESKKGSSVQSDRKPVRRLSLDVLAPTKSAVSTAHEKFSF